MVRSSLLVSMLAVAAASGAILTPVPAAADPPAAVVLGPAPLKPVPGRSKRLLAVGLSTFLGGYVPFAALGIGALAREETGRSWGWGLVPVAGPWIALAQPRPDTGTGDPGGGPAVLVLDVFMGLLGVSQGVGAIALGAYAAPPETETDQLASGVRIQPVIGFGAAGVVGTF